MAAKDTLTTQSNEPKKSYKDILDNTFKSQLFQVRTDFNRWVNAINRAESILAPDRTELMQIYKDITIDAHISGIVEAIKNSVLSNEFVILNSKGEPDNDIKSAIFEQEWFFKLLGYIVDSQLYGYSLVQICGVKDNSILDVELVPREYVVPELNLVKTSLWSGDLNTGNKYIGTDFEKWTIIIDTQTLGLLNKVAPLAIGKKNVLLNWLEFAELFAMPLRIAKTDIDDPLRRQNAEKMLRGMGSAAWAVMHTDDQIEFPQSARTDAFGVYKEAIDLQNNEISKALAGQTGMFDAKSYTGAAKTHEELFAKFIGAYLRLCKFVINGKLIPKMQALGIKGIDGIRFKWQFEENLGMLDKTKIIESLNKSYNVNPEFANEYLDLDAEGMITEKTDPTKKQGISSQEDFKNYQNKIKQLYENGENA